MNVKALIKFFIDYREENANVVDYDFIQHGD